MRHAAIVVLFAILAGFSVRNIVAQSSNDSLHARSGGVSTSVESITIPPLPGASFTATVTTEWKRTLEDGSTVTLGNHRTVARDNSGRVFEERHNLYPAGDPRQDTVARLEYNDPQAHTRTTCWPEAHVCQVTGYFVSASTPRTVPAGPQEGGKAFLTRVELGHDSIGGVEAVGTRETTQIEAGAFGNDRAISVVKEFWYSPQLGVNLIEKRQDPRYGSQTFTVSSISLGEPDAKLFEIPADFHVEDR